MSYHCSSSIRAAGFRIELACLLFSCESSGPFYLLSSWPFYRTTVSSIILATLSTPTRSTMSTYSIRVATSFPRCAPMSTSHSHRSRRVVILSTGALRNRPSCRRTCQPKSPVSSSQQVEYSAPSKLKVSSPNCGRSTPFAINGIDTVSSTAPIVVSRDRADGGHKRLR